MTSMNAAGEYNFVTLQPGTYALRVSVSGFKTFERRDLTVDANDITRLNVKLEVGNVQQSITVAGEGPTLQTDRAETHAEVSSAELGNLPVPPGRNYQQLYRALPGFAPPFNSHSIPTNPSRSLEFHVNGTSDDQNNTRIDGVSSTTVQLPHIVSYVPALESIQEVNVVTSSFDAEQGLAGGAAINVQIKSGTNQVHGSLFEYHTNQHLKAWPEAVPPGEVNKPKAIYNQGGGTIGGHHAPGRASAVAPGEGPAMPARGAYFGAWVKPPAYTQQGYLSAVTGLQRQIGRRLRRRWRVAADHGNGRYRRHARRVRHRHFANPRLLLCGLSSRAARREA